MPVDLERELKRHHTRYDDLVKQDVTLKREYTMLLRKTSSLLAVLEKWDASSKAVAESNAPKNISDHALERAPALKWYNAQIARIAEIQDVNDIADLPDEINDLYEDFVSTPLLYNDSMKNQ